MLIFAGAPRCTRLVQPPSAPGGVIDPSLRAGARIRMRDVLRDVPPRCPWSMNAWIDRLERRRRRDIDLMAVDYAPGRPSGAWQRREDYELIAYTAGTSPMHQGHIIAHELGHLLCEHRGVCLVSDAGRRRWRPTSARTRCRTCSRV
ncbi:ImmA/IrrE family metallo-endopeptidase [Amycolatopsis sp. FDAARGOS 1241]|uniref:ImmA/IrrE family metallo-endopeptidase n=1 Tax=Amycolatopsis sp. FDAARGOS 1241 TaxID=2778070 RepID=UPI001EF1A2E5|nr:ImmA/IrrE family metallo-endopeptidase [Amycolatopsis sp. FDAARGOS 1241]